MPSQIAVSASPQDGGTPIICFFSSEWLKSHTLLKEFFLSPILSLTLIPVVYNILKIFLLTL